jgi:hypothetical protein
LGWSIEGAIGSVFKVDASYLSSNVTMSNKLEEKTKTYGVSLIFTGELYEYLSNEAKEYARIIDINEIKDQEDLRLFTIDIDFSYLKCEEKDLKNINEQDNSELMDKLRKVNKNISLIF